MCRVFLTSDIHWDHEAMVIKHRKFQSLEDQRDLIIKNWNKTVHKRDLTIIAGDLTMEKANYDWLDLLNGRKIAVLGNHDLRQHVRALMNHVDSVCGAYDYKGYIITHIPIHKRELVGRFCGNIHGHVHFDSIEDWMYYNVSIDANRYTPKLFTEIDEEMKIRKLNYLNK